MIIPIARLGRRLHAAACASALLAALFTAAGCARTGTSAHTQPLTSAETALVGTYRCDKSEAHRVWGATDVITLNPDFSSTYSEIPGEKVTAGTWAYSSPAQEVHLTNFPWATLKFTPPNGLHASNPGKETGVETAIDCERYVDSK
jgi:ABC-type phosphate transport system substrate-binding protein